MKLPSNIPKVPSKPINKYDPSIPIIAPSGVVTKSTSKIDFSPPTPPIISKPISKPTNKSEIFRIIKDSGYALPVIQYIYLNYVMK